MFFVTYLMALAAALAIRDEPKPLKYSLNKNVAKAAVDGDRRFRTAPGPQQADLWVDRIFYLIDIDLGTKGQKVSVEVDTGSADLWVAQEHVQDLSAWKNTSEAYYIYYGDKTLILGWFGTSTIWLNSGLEVPDFEWMVATDVKYNPNRLQGMFGIGRVENEAGGARYPNFVQHLKDLGYIKTNGYLYYLNQKDATSGSIVFGGIDKAKIKGEVAKLPLNKNTERSKFDSINLTKLTGVNGEVFVEDIEVILDTGYTYSHLPKLVIDQIKKQIPTQTRESDGQIFVSCELDPNKYILFWFNDVEVKVSLSDMAIKTRDNDGNLTGWCALGVQQTQGDNPNVLGVSTLTHTYVTVDHDNEFAYISNVNYTDDEDLVLL